MLGSSTLTGSTFLSSHIPPTRWSRRLSRSSWVSAAASVSSTVKACGAVTPMSRRSSGVSSRSPRRTVASTRPSATCRSCMRLRCRPVFWQLRWRRSVIRGSPLPFASVRRMRAH
uniref:Uncharacterized protein n=1 Tax=Rhodococcus erythropolis TaxID=1833 RepID=B1VDA2_RHOER|nr:hypothetical protein [Rhodococcus erythropolis]